MAAKIETEKTTTDLFSRRLTAALFAAVAAWAAIHVVFARVFGDEGWYLNAARELLAGRWPHLDFFYPQGPAAVFVHLPVMIFAPGIATARVQSFLLFMAALALGWSILRRDGRLAGGPWWLALVGLHAMLVNMCTLVVSAPYELFATVLALWFVQRRRPVAAMIVLATVACLRVSMAVPAAVFWFYGVATAPRGERAGAAGRLLAGALLPPLLLVGPFLLLAPGRLLDGLLFYHVWGGRFPISAGTAWHHRLQFMLDIVRVYWPVVGLAVLGWWRSRPRAWDSFEVLLLGAAATMTVVHALPATPDPRYHVVPAALTALFAARRLAEKSLPRWAVALLLLAIVPWEMSSYTLRWEHLKQDLRAPAAFRQIARQVGALAGGQPVLTFETALAVEGGFAVPPKYELGYFSLTPLTDQQRVERDRLLTAPQLLRDLTEARYPVVAVYEDDLGNLPAAERQQAADALHRRYRFTARYPGLGQLRQMLFVFVRQPLAPPTTEPPATGQ